MNGRRLLAVLAVVLLSATVVAPLLADTQLSGGSQQPIKVNSNDVCALGMSCYPHPLTVQVVSSYEIQVPSPRGSVRFAVQVDSGAVEVGWRVNGGSTITWQASAGQQGLVNETVRVLSGANYTLTVQNASDSPSVVGISIWYVV